MVRQDTHFPVPSALLAEKGAELILCPHASAVETVSSMDENTGFAPGRTESREAGELKYERWLRYVPARAYDNSVFTAICNQCGLGPAAHPAHVAAAGGGASFDGGGVTFVCGPAGDVLARGPSFDESLLVHTLEAAELERVRGTPISFFRRWHHPKTREWAAEISGSRL